MTLKIGITGPIGCGKTTVGRWLEEAGAIVIDADAVVREVTAPGEPALDAVIKRFGPAFRRSDGSLDRSALGRLVFGNPSALRDLEAIIHPAVRPRIDAAIEAAEAAGAPVVVVEAIKLVESGLAGACDETWLIACDRAAQRRRLVGRGASRGEADQRIEAQGNLIERLRPAATRVLDTTGDPIEVRRRVLGLLAEAGADQGLGH